MRGLRKRRVNGLSVVEPALKKFKTTRSKSDLDPTKVINSIRSNGFLKNLEVVLDRSIVNNYLDSKDLLRSRLGLDSNETRTSHERYVQENNFEGTVLNGHVESHGNRSRLSEEAEYPIHVKVESEDTNDNLCSNDNLIDDNALVKQESTDEMIDVENLSDSEANPSNLDSAAGTEQQTTDFSINNEINRVLPDENVDVENLSDSETNPHNAASIEQQPTKSSNNNKDRLVSSHLNNGAINNDIQEGSHLQNQESQSDSILMNQSAAQKPTTKNHYYCDNCYYKTFSKLCIYRHMRDKHNPRDGYVFPCKKCKRKFKSELVLQVHQKKCGTKLYLTCKFCSKMSAHRCVLRKHIITQHPEDFEMEKFEEIMQQIIVAGERRDVKKMTKKLKGIPVPRMKKIRSNLDPQKSMKMYCSMCKVVSERGNSTIATACSKCDTTLRFQCQMCGKTYPVIGGLRAHIRWSCKNAAAKLTSDADNALSNFERKKTVIVDTKVNEESLSDERNYNCKECKTRKVKGKRRGIACKHIEQRRAGYRYQNELIVCLKCNERFIQMLRFVEHKIMCGVQIRFACPFCPYTCKVSADAKRHLEAIHHGLFDKKKLEDIYDEVKKERNRVKEQYIADHSSKNAQPSNSSDLETALKFYCSNCDTLHDVKKDNKVSKLCPDCKKLMECQCQRCGKSYLNFNMAHIHDTSLCKFLNKES